MSEQENNLTQPNGLDALVNRERIRGQKRIIAEGTEPASVTPQQIEAVANDAELARQAWGLTRKDIAAAVGCTQRMIGDFLAARKTPDTSQLSIDVESWLVAEEQRRQRPEVSTFTMTNTVVTIKATANYCLDHKTIGLCYGPDSTGIGK